MTRRFPYLAHIGYVTVDEGSKALETGDVLGSGPNDFGLAA